MASPQFASKKPTKANTDSGYHGLSEDETDPDQDTVATKKLPEDRAKDDNMMLQEQPVVALVETASPSPERATTTEGSFHSAREGPNDSEEAMPIPRSAGNLPDMQEQDAATPTHARDTSLKAKITKVDPMDLDQHDDDLALDEPIDGSHSPSQGSSPFEPLVRKSSLTFAALPAPEPWTTKKSMGARVSRTSQLDQSKNTLGRGSYLGRITGGKSLGASKQLDADFDVEGDVPGDDMDVDKAPQPAIVGEESDGDAKMTRLHNKSSTQRLHEKISMLGKPQPARPTKSIPANSGISQPSYPQLPLTDMQIHAAEQMSHSVSKPVGTLAPEEDEDDWIQPPPVPTIQSKRPQLSKSTTADVMEHIIGKQHIGDNDFEPGLGDDAVHNEHSTSRPPASGTNSMSPNLTRSASAVLLGSPRRDAAAAETSSSTASQTSGQPAPPASTTTQAETPASKRNADGPISASKSKLQSIMKTARGLFTSSAGVSAQAKIEALSSPSTRTRGKVQDGHPSNATANRQLNEQGHPPRDSMVSVIPKQPEVRKTRSSTEKEEKRKEQEARMREQTQSLKMAVEVQQGGPSEPANVTNATHKEGSQPRQGRPSQPARPIRQSPRRLQKQSEIKQSTEGNEIPSSNINDMASGHLLGPPQAQPSQLQRPKDVRRPVKPAKETASKPIPQKIRVGPPSALSQHPQRMPVSNSAHPSSLQESLPPAHANRPGLVKKASNASIQTSISNASLKSSNSSKPKALIAAERKKEQVIPLTSTMLTLY